jgi:hypothetical protein
MLTAPSPDGLTTVVLPPALGAVAKDLGVYRNADAMTAKRTEAHVYLEKESVTDRIVANPFVVFL